MLAEARAVGPYVNFFFDKKVFASSMLEEVFARGIEYGNAPKTGERVLIEYAAPNTHKEIHVGHLRNFFIGLSTVNLFRAAGGEVIPVNYINDNGANVTKCLWAYKKFHDGEVPVDRRSKFLGAVYTEATQYAEEHQEESKVEISDVQKKLDAKDPEWTTLWRTTRDWCLEEYRNIFAELRLSFEKDYLASEFEGSGKQTVRELLEKGIAKRGDGGAVIMDFEEEKLGVFLLLKSDGSALYSTFDLGLAPKKFQDFPGVSRSLHVVDNRQSLYFKQLFATLRKMGFDFPMHHIAHDFVTLAEGAMSSRKGNIITYEDFRDRMIDMVADETRKRRDGWSEQKIKDTAWVIAEGAMKFAMLKQDNDRPIVFEMEAALSFDGFTGPYIQYAHARLCSILARAGESGEKYELSDDPVDYALLRLVADFPATVLAAAALYRPSLLSQYLFDLAQASNDFYRDAPVLSAEPDVRARRLAVIRAAKITLENGLELLGIRAPEEM